MTNKSFRFSAFMKSANWALLSPFVMIQIWVYLYSSNFTPQVEQNLLVPPVA